MIKVNCDYRIKDDIEFILESEKMNVLELSDRTQISRTTLDKIAKGEKVSDSVCEKFYAYVYEKRYRLNSVKEELIKENYQNVLFHGSRDGLSEITVTGSRDNCDFGNGFYLGENYNQALSFVCEKENSSVYSFRYSLDGLKIKKYSCNLEWMLAICYNRGTIKNYINSKKVKEVISEFQDVDVIIAPIADNKMFYIMSQFAEGEINTDAALHSLSASSLGLQYIFKTDKALNNLKPIERYYLSKPERKACRELQNERSFEIDTKLKLAKRNFRTGLYIEEILG